MVLKSYTYITSLQLITKQLDQRNKLHFRSVTVMQSIFPTNRKLFSCVCIAWYKHSRGWENLRQLCKPSTSSRVCITVKNSPYPSSVYIRLWKPQKKALCCFYKITFPRKKKNSLFRLLMKREVFTSREVLYAKLNVRVISSCFAIKMLSTKRFFSLKMSA